MTSMKVITFASLFVTLPLGHWCSIGNTLKEDGKTILKQESPSTCNPDCLLEINIVRNYTDSLDKNQSKKYDDLHRRIEWLEERIKLLDTLESKVNSLENQLTTSITNLNTKIDDNFNFLNNALNTTAGRITTVEQKVSSGQAALGEKINEVLTNVTSIQNNLSKDLQTQWEDTQTLVAKTNDDLLQRITDVALLVNKTQPGGNTPNNPSTTPPPTEAPPVGGDVGQMFLNLTRRVDGLEFGTIKNLSNDNTMWRRNFRIVNSTFDRMKKNGCMC